MMQNDLDWERLEKTEEFQADAFLNVWKHTHTRKNNTNNSYGKL